MSRRSLSLLVAALGLTSTACVLGPNPKLSPRVADGSYCAPREPLQLTATHVSTDAPSIEPSDAAKRHYTPRTLDVARAIGALGRVERLAEAEERHATSAELADLRGEVNDSITVASLEVSSTIANLSCEEGRATQIAADLRAAEGIQTRRLTAWSVVVSAAAAIAGGVLAVADKNPVPAAVVGIGGGVLGGGFGFATLAVHASTTFRHRPNMLGEVWRADGHPSFPDIVWGYLTRPEFSRTKERTLSEHLLTSWKEAGTLGDDTSHPDAEKTKLYFGDGGTYDADGLGDRANMLSDVREVVGLINHGLRRLAAEVAAR